MKIEPHHKRRPKIYMGGGNAEWETPAGVFAALNAEFQFTLDAAASADNAKCRRFFTKAENGLRRSWDRCTFVNPPYGRELSAWVRKAVAESANGKTIVMLLPARTETTWFHRYILHRFEIRFIQGRLSFGDGCARAVYGSMIVIFRGRPAEFRGLDEIKGP